MPEKVDSQVPGPSSCTVINAAVPQIRAEPPNAPLVSLATPQSDVSAFCQAVLSNLIPDRFWGEGNQGQDNKEVVMRNTDRFVRLRRFESLSLHAVFQGLKVIGPPNQKRGVKLTPAVDMYDLVETSSSQPFHEGCSFRC